MATAQQAEMRKRQAELGQFFTPTPVAEFMASLFAPLPPTVRLLDPGAGSGALTAAFVSEMCRRRNEVCAIEVTTYEIDSRLQHSLLATMRLCQRLCLESGIRFTFSMHESDFIQEIAPQLAQELFAGKPPRFDAAVANPPYRKISNESAERRALISIGVETSNLYAGFVAVIQRLLADGGQMVCITPRSFCNGPYFQPFRERLLREMELRRLHVFESRSAAFRQDKVLQENVVFHAVKGPRVPTDVVISVSSGREGDRVSETVVPFSDVVHPDDPEKFIHLPVAPEHLVAKELLGSLRSTLAALGVNVSTGPVVDFRLKHSIRRVPEKGTVPLLYPCHFSGGAVRWPKLDARKPDAIIEDDETRRWLIPSGVYVL
ncbi:MAG: N-6 DNA methylase, partial [Opitutaceae bacterium]